MVAKSKTSKKYVHSFSTNFFGVIGYIGSSLVWLLVLTCVVLLTPSSGDVVAITEEAQRAITLPLDTNTAAAASSSESPFFTFLLSILALIVFWAFSYVASRILSRIVRRVVGIFHKKVTAENLLKTKYFILAIGLMFFALLLMVVPSLIWLKISISLIGLIAGFVGLGAIWLQYHLSKRHHVPIAHLL
ncbi:hypothetical protein HY312_00045 [Candidatus Saccharibacteria bacterium]|nr:hypothetical protein [Candidatus Saccharibacteria bacterium]